jgi:hypothetical protein
MEVDAAIVGFRGVQRTIRMSGKRKYQSFVEGSANG